MTPGDYRIWCGFDGGICGYSQDLTDEADWLFRKGTTPTSLTGPQADHTTGEGTCGCAPNKLYPISS